MDANMAASLENATFLFHSYSLDERRDKEHSVVLNRYFNHALTVIVPGVNVVPTPVVECFSDQLAYRLHRLPLYRLIEMPFVQAFVKKGAVHMMSINTKLDTGDCVAVTPTGWLLLHLTKDTYEELGLEARKQTHSEKISDIYVVHINLLADHFRPGKKGYNRVMWCLKDRLNLEFDFLVAWEPHDDSVCSSSMGVYFTEKCLKVERVGQEKTSRAFTSLPCPKIDATQPEGSEDGCHYQEVFEWMGAIACGIDMTSEGIGADSYTSTFTCPDPKYNCPRGCVFQVSGFITPRTVLKVWNALRDYTTCHPESLPTSLTVHGFADSCVSYKLVPHQFYVSGDNIYSFLLLPANRCWSYVASVS
ncbi:hypothetical protein BsWGS_15804 [Bradybaena similaris]